MVTNQPKDGPEGSMTQTQNWHLDPQEGSMLQTLNFALKLESQTIPRMVTHQPKDGHPPEGSMLQTQNLALGHPRKKSATNSELGT